MFIFAGPRVIWGLAGVFGDEGFADEGGTGSESREGADFHAEVERKLRMDW